MEKKVQKLKKGHTIYKKYSKSLKCQMYKRVVKYI